MGRLMMMAGGTGGHIMPALAVAEKLRDRGIEVTWIGNEQSLEAKLVPAAGFALDFIRIKGLRQSGLKRKLTMPFMLGKACLQALNIIRRQKPDVLVGMGGFVSGPGGLIGGLLGKPLVLHEQNAVAGMTNRWLAKLSKRTLTGFPQSEGLNEPEWVGNPVRESIAAIPVPAERLANRTGPIRILVVGGSLGAQVLNQRLPELLARENLPGLTVRHQCGKDNSTTVAASYQKHEINYQVDDFIDDMAAAYEWSDIVICRAGAMTVAEVCAAGVAALFIPYPHAVSDHQTRNAEYLATSDAAILCSQTDFIDGEWVSKLAKFANDRSQLINMAAKARAFAKPNAAEQVADICEALIHA